VGKEKVLVVTNEVHINANTYSAEHANHIGMSRDSAGNCILKYKTCKDGFTVAAQTFTPEGWARLLELASTAFCYTCGHSWTLRGKMPGTCPKCSSKYWKLPREQKGGGKRSRTKKSTVRRKLSRLLSKLS